MWWNTANDAVLVEGAMVLIEDPDRLDGARVSALTSPARCWTGRVARSSRTRVGTEPERATRSIVRGGA